MPTDPTDSGLLTRLSHFKAPWCLQYNFLHNYPSLKFYSFTLAFIFFPLCLHFTILCCVCSLKNIQTGSFMGVCNGFANCTSNYYALTILFHFYVVTSICIFNNVYHNLICVLDRSDVEQLAADQLFNCSSPKSDSNLSLQQFEKFTFPSFAGELCLDLYWNL